MDKTFFIDYENICRVLISAPIMYISVIIYIRILGKRSTSQLNSFDWIVTVAMGSLVASTIVIKNVSIMDGLAAILALLLLQFLLTKITLLFPSIKKIIRSTPQLLLYNGEFIKKNMKKERVVESEVLAAMRENGIQNIDEVHAVVLETNAKFSVISKSENNSSFTLADVQGLPEGLKQDIEKRRNKTA